MKIHNHGSPEGRKVMIDGVLYWEVTNYSNFHQLTKAGAEYILGEIRKAHPAPEWYEVDADVEKNEAGYWRAWRKHRRLYNG